MKPRFFLLLAVLVVPVAALLGVHLAQSFGLSAPCAPNNHQINDARLLTSTFLNLGQTGVIRPRATFQHGYLYVAAGTSVVKLDETGRQVGSFLTPGQVSGIALDGAGNLYAAGSLISAGMGTGLGSSRNGETYRHYGKGGTGDAFVVKERPDGHIVWRTDLGGAMSDGGSVNAVSNAGEVWTGGTTISDDFPLRHPFERHYHGPSLSRLPAQGAAFPDDSWIASLDIDGRLAFSSYLGGSENDELTALATDHAGQPVLFGWTDSPDFAFTRRIVAPPSSGPPRALRT